LSKTTDTGNTFVDITGNFLSICEPSYSFYHPLEIWLIKVLKSNNTNIVYVAGKQGLYWAEDIGVPLSWYEVPEIPKVIVKDLTVETESGSLIVTTFGRGMWKIDNLGD